MQSILGKFRDDVTEVWAWFLPTVMPTLSLIVGVLTLDLTGAGGTDKQIDRFIFQLAFGLSLVYLAFVLLTVLLYSFTGDEPLVLMKRSNLWLGPFQGLVAAGLGAFYVRAERGRR